jgi:hypothetical protein
LELDAAQFPEVWVANYNFCLKTSDSAGLLTMAVCSTRSHHEGPTHTALIPTDSGGRRIAAGYSSYRWQRH